MYRFTSRRPRQATLGRFGTETSLIHSLLRLLAVIACVARSVSANADPAIWYAYTSGAGVPKVAEIKGATELYLLGDGCYPEVISGTIESVDFRRGTRLPETFNVRRTDGSVELINIGESALGKLSSSDLDWLGKLIAPKRRVLIIAARCGASGRIVYVRDVYDLTYLRPLIH